MFKSLPSFLLSALIHGALLALVLFSYDWELEPQQRFSQQPVEIVKAVVIDDGQLQAEMAKLHEEERRKQIEEKERQAELERQALLAEEKRLAELEKKQQEEKRRQAEAKRLAEVKKREEAEKKQKEALEAKRAAEEKKRIEQEKKKEAEKRRLAEEAKRKKEKEAIEAEAKRKAEEEKIKREAELQRQRVAEQRRLQSLRGEYINMIAQHVERYWRRPPSAKPGLSCTVKVKQIPGGEVISARVDICNGDLVVHRSIEAAVLRASPLPVPPDPALFDRNLEFTFKPRE